MAPQLPPPVGIPPVSSWTVRNLGVPERSLPPPPAAQPPGTTLRGSSRWAGWGRTLLPRRDHQDRRGEGERRRSPAGVGGGEGGQGQP